MAPFLGVPSVSKHPEMPAVVFFREDVFGHSLGFPLARSGVEDYRLQVASFCAACTCKSSDVHSDNVHVRLTLRILSEVLSDVFRVLGIFLRVVPELGPVLKLLQGQ